MNVKMRKTKTRPNVGDRHTRNSRSPTTYNLNICT